ncbi:pentapeptide repeat-containing protein [Mycoavidus sp. SF9855]|uniref:WD40 domain-containing protein n=1 Tax=Mycoavidus sp. SF9855 TaxID=2968475 RepID=UPI00211C5658|nr:pentapeptide repeat-containing protein [Mycoavidus sp. SF9855]UUM22244.1 pentapeptide repeat-containing protein [Mycoavidus sp. SF9855]
MMLDNPVSQTLANHQAQIMLAKICLDQARQQKTAQQLDVALVLYDQAKVTFKRISDTRKLAIELSEVKSALSQAQTPQTEEDEALRRHIADIYFERAEVLNGLEKFDKARASYKKAKDWGHELTEADPIAPVEHDAPILAQTSMPASMSVREKGELVDYLFERALFTLGSLNVSNKPSIFLVYAHDNPDPNYGEADASTSKYFINHLSSIQVTLNSDQTPLGQPYSDSFEDLKEDGKLEDILTSQLCLLPAQVEKEVKSVNKVVVCCSEVLGKYLKWLHYEEFYLTLQKAYREDREAYGKDREQSSAPAIREVVRKFSQEAEYKAGFHHVLTEMAFLQIRAKELKDQHGIIPVSLTPNGSMQCLAHFIPATTVRMEDIPRFEGQKLSPNQSRHWVLFKLIERLLVGSNEAKMFLDKFWQGYDDFISQLNARPMLGRLEFAKQLDGIFDSIRTALHSQLFFSVQQHQQQLRELNANPRSAIKEQYFDALGQDEEFEETLQLYVEPRGKANSHEADTFNLLPKIQAFLNDEKVKVILLTGDSGAGKTSFNRVLEKQLWKDKKEHDAIPLFISLASIDNPLHDLISTALKKRGLSKDQIQRLKKEKQRFIFILDGYDEIRQTKNLYQSNGINQPGSWQGQMVISCRSEYLGQGQGYRKWFQPDQYRQGEARSFQEAVIEPFSGEEQNWYLEKYVERNQPIWSAQQFKEALEQPHLKELVSNPFLLRVVLEVLPYIKNEGKSRSAIQLRMDLYNQFVRQWFERNEQRLILRDLTENKREIFREMCDEGFAEHGIDFVEDLAVHLYVKNAGNPVVEYSSLKDKGNWKKEFFALDDKKQLLREAWPLSRSGNQYRFIHKLLLEYFAARVLFASLDACMMVDTRHLRANNTSVYSFENQTALPPQTLRDMSLAPKHWIGDLGVVRLLTERVQQETVFKKHLLAIIERSKTDAEVSQTAANAITILVKAGVQLSNKDFNRICVSGADLSYGVFDHTQFEEADLNRANLVGAWLRKANLRSANLAGVEFGELPYLEMGAGVLSSCYSPDGRWLAVGTYDGRIHIYQVDTLALLHTLPGHTGAVNSVTYSSDSKQLASGSLDSTVKLWDVESAEELYTLLGHTDAVTSVAYSPDGKQLASGSWDSTVKLWGVENAEELHTLPGHTGKVSSVTYSPNGEQLALGCWDGTVKLWDVGSTVPKELHPLPGHTGAVRSVTYSPNGKQLASSSSDKTVKLWDVGSAVPKALYTLTGHTGSVTSVAYSRDGKQLASGSWDNTVKLWDVESAEPKELHTLEGHKGAVNSVMYSRDGKQLISGSEDQTVKLWNMESIVSKGVNKLAGHTERVTEGMYSPNGKRLVSRSFDKTVKLWDLESVVPKALHTFAEHTWSVTYSPDGKQLALGCSDNTVKLWDVESAVPKKLHTLAGHMGAVSSVAYSRIGKQLASGSFDNTVKLWDVESAKELHTLPGHNGVVSSVAYSPDGKRLASGSLDGTVKLWDVGSAVPKALHTLTRNMGPVGSVIYSPNGKQLASSGWDSAVKLWDVESAEKLHTLAGHKSCVNNVTYSPDGKQLASSSSDNTVRVWSVASGECLKVIEGFVGDVLSVAWREGSAEVDTLVTGGTDKAIRLWRIENEGEGYRIILNWTTHQAVLTVDGASIEGATLSPMNARLLEQRGVVIPSEEDPANFIPTSPPSSVEADTFEDMLEDMFKDMLKHMDLELKTIGFSEQNLQSEIMRNQLVDSGSSKLSSLSLHLIEDPKRLQSLAKEVQANPSSKNFLLNLVKRSKMDANLQITAANALTILVKAKVPLTGEDFSGIQVAEADLSYGIFDHTQFENADLSQVNFQGAWLRRANFKGATLAGVEFGEMPTLALKAEASICRYSPNGLWLAIATNMGIKLYHQATTLEPYILEEGTNTGAVHSIAFSPNNEWLACGKHDGTIQLWSMEKDTPVLRHTLKEHNHKVLGVAFSEDSKLLASSDNETIKLWKLNDIPIFVHTFIGHTDKILSVAFSRSAGSGIQWLASGSSDNTVRLWDVKKGTLVHILEGHTSWVNSVAFSPDNEWLASASADKIIKLWKLGVNKPPCEHTLEGHSYSVRDVAFSSDNKWLASASIDRTVKLWTRESFEPKHTFEGHSDSVEGVAFSSDSKWLASSSIDKTVRLRKVEISTSYPISEGHAACIKSLTFSPNGKWLASGGADKTVNLWDAQTHKLLRKFPERNAAVFSSDNKLALVNHEKIELHSIETLSSIPSSTLETDSGSAILSMAFSQDGNWLTLVSEDKTAELRSFQAGKFKKGYINSACTAFSSDSKRLASVNDDGTISLYSLESNEPEFLYDLEGHSDQVYSIAFSPSPNSNWLASAGYDKTIKLWNVRTDQSTPKAEPSKCTFEGHTDSVYSIAFSPNGEWLISGSADMTVRLWSIASEKCLAVIQGFYGGVSSIVWQDDNTFLTGGEDKAIRLWQIIKAKDDTDAFQVNLRWASHQTVLATVDISIRETKDLSEINQLLLTQKSIQERPLTPIQSKPVPSYLKLYRSGYA